MATTIWQASPIRPTSLITGPNSAFARLFPEKYRQQQELSRKQRSKSTESQRSNPYRVGTTTLVTVDHSKVSTTENAKKLSRGKPTTNNAARRLSRAKSESHLNRIHLISNDPNCTQVIYQNKTNDIQYARAVGIRHLKSSISPEPCSTHGTESRKLSRPPSLVLSLAASAPPRTPSPIIIREKPPKPPDYESPKIITKTILPSSQSLRHVVLKRVPPLPAKPRSLVVEKWLSHQTKPTRPVVYQRTTDTPEISQPVRRNVILDYKPADVKVKHEVQNIGCFCVDPKLYQAKYGSSLRRSDSIRKVLESVGCNPDLFSSTSSCESNHISSFKNTNDRLTDSHLGKLSNSTSADKKLDALIGAMIPTSVENHYDVPRVHYDSDDNRDKTLPNKVQKAYLPKEDCDFREAPSSSRNS